MKSETVPYRRMIFVCANVDEKDGRPACGLRGSPKILEVLKEEVKKRGLKGKVRALKSGCMDLCEKGPNVMVFPEGCLISGVVEADIPALVEKYLA
jgi:(2Fe-2S) ferredoxin